MQECQIHACLARCRRAPTISITARHSRTGTNTKNSEKRFIHDIKCEKEKYQNNHFEGNSSSEIVQNYQQLQCFSQVGFYRYELMERYVGPTFKSTQQEKTTFKYKFTHISFMFLTMKHNPRELMPDVFGLMPI